MNACGLEVLDSASCADVQYIQMKLLSAVDTRYAPLQNANMILDHNKGVSQDRANASHRESRPLLLVPQLAQKFLST